MDCKEVKSRLGAYYDDYLSSDERADVEEHLRSCASCAAELAALIDLDALATRLTVPDPGDAFWRSLPGRVRDELDGRIERPRESLWSRFARWVSAPGPGLRLAGALTAVMLVVVVSLYVSHHPQVRMAGEHSVLTPLEQRYASNEDVSETGGVSRERAVEPATETPEPEAVDEFEEGRLDMRAVPTRDVVSAEDVVDIPAAPSVARSEMLDRTAALPASGGIAETHKGISEEARLGFAAAPPLTDDSALYEQARQYQTRGYFDKAAENFDAVVDAEPSGSLASEAAFESNVISQMQIGPDPAALAAMNVYWNEYRERYPGARDDEVRFQVFQNTLTIGQVANSTADLMTAKALGDSLLSSPDPAIRENVMRGLAVVDSILSTQDGD
jgi:hypothetical protein